jgi:hypothetical protein
MRTMFNSRPSDLLRATTCDRCHTPVGVVHCDALPWVLELRDLTPAEEAAAVLDGRHTFGAYGRPPHVWTRWRNPTRLVQKGMPRMGALIVMAEHKCEKGGDRA